MLGWTEEEVLGHSYAIVPDDETRLKRKDGTLVDVVLSVAPLLDADGRPRGTIAVITDVTERKRLELELRQSQKMEAVGRLAGGIAHDFNNLLTVIIGRGESVLANLERSDPSRWDVELMLATSERAATLTRQLLAFSRRQVLQPKVLALHEVVGNVVPMLRRLIGEDIEIHTVAGAAPGRVRVDPAQIEQVIMNLAVNARDAMPQGGVLMITTTTADVTDVQARRLGGIQSGRWAILSVSDTGAGMDEETRVRVFEPFFTTKPLGQGTGLGLSMVYGIVEQHGGTITVESAPGRGTTFRIYLPRVDDAAAETETMDRADRTALGTETILLVEDEDEVRELVGRMLQRSGYTVLVAADPRAALELSGRHTGPIHLLLTDVVMPEMSGRELRDRLSALRPEAKVVYMSGYTDEALGRHGVLEPDVVLLQKPFRFAELADRIREVLDA
jgi:signal transduction histidine kinase